MALRHLHLSLIGLLLLTGVALADPAQTAADHRWTWGGEQLARVDESLARLNTALDQLLRDPQPQSLADARRAWQESRREWLQLSPLLQLAQVNGERFRELDNWIFQIAADDLEPGYLDALPDHSLAGLVNDLAIPLTPASLRQQHGLTDPSEISLGYHALELLLWGADGQRPPDELREQQQLDGEQRRAGYALEEVPNNRRRTLLRLLGSTLQEDVQQLRKLWLERDSALGRSYWRLRRDQRLPLLRQALQSLLLSLDNRHPQAFAGGDERVALLTGLHSFMTQGEPSLIQVMLKEPDATAWLAQLQKATASLESSTTGSGEYPWEALAAALSPATPAPVDQPPAKQSN